MGRSGAVWCKLHVRENPVSRQSSRGQIWSLRTKLHHGTGSIKSISCRESNQMDEFTAGIIHPTADRPREINRSTKSFPFITEVKNTMIFIIADKKIVRGNNITFTYREQDYNLSPGYSVLWKKPLRLSVWMLLPCEAIRDHELRFKRYCSERSHYWDQKGGKNKKCTNLFLPDSSDIIFSSQSTV